MAFQLKHMAGNHTQQNTRLFSVRNTLLALSIFSSGFTSSGYAAIGEKTDGEFIVNEKTTTGNETTGEQSNASVAMDADGDFVVTWHSNAQDGNGFDIFARHFNVNDSTEETVFSVSTKNSNQQYPDIAMDADGDFVVVWQSFKQEQDGDNFGIYGQRFNSDGKGDEFPVNFTTNSNQINPSIAMDADGDFVVVWQSNHDITENENSGYNVFGRRFYANGEPVEPEFLVNSAIESDQESPEIAMEANGDFVVVWQSNNNTAEYDDSGYGVFGRRFYANGEPVEPEFLVNSATDSDQKNPDVAMDTDGDFVVVWQSDEQDGDDAGIFGKRYDANGLEIKLNYEENSEFSVNIETSSDQQNPSVAMDTDGDFVVSWQSDGNDGNDGNENDRDDSRNGVFSRIFYSDDEKGRNEFLVNTETSSDQENPNVAMDDDGDFIVAWQSDGNTEDTSEFGVFGQRYQGNPETIGLDLVINGPERVTTGNNFTYALIVTNKGSGIATGIQLTGAIPVGVEYVSDDSVSAGWSCERDDPTLVCKLPFLNSGESSTINVTVKSIRAGAVHNEATASSAQGAEAKDDLDTTSSLDASGSGGGSLSWLSGALFLFALRRKKIA